MSDRTRQVFEGAIALLERDGWQKRRSGPVDVEAAAPRCLVGACDAMTHHLPFDDTDPGDWYRELCYVVGERTGRSLQEQAVIGIASWNDQYERGEDEVIAVLRRAAELAGT